MATAFDPDSGLLRLAHADLSVLVMLARDANDPRLHDHAVAGPIASLRAAGIVGARGIDPSVAPLVTAIADSDVTLALDADDRGVARRALAWVSDDLAVLAVAALDGGDAYEMMADRPSMFPVLVEELVGLGPGGDPTASGPPPAGGDAVRWQLRRRDGGAGAVAVVDAGTDGLWAAAGEASDFAPATPARVRELVAEVAGLSPPGS